MLHASDRRVTWFAKSTMGGCATNRKGSRLSEQSATYKAANHEPTRAKPNVPESDDCGELPDTRAVEAITLLHFPLLRDAQERTVAHRIAEYGLGPRCRTGGAVTVSLACREFCNPAMVAMR